MTAVAPMAAEVAALFSGMKSDAERLGRALHSIHATNCREVPVTVGRSGARPLHVGRAEWARRRRIDSWRRRRDRRHGPRTRLMSHSLVIPRARIVPTEDGVAFTATAQPGMES